MGRPKMTEKEFWSKVKKTDTCWEYQGSVGRDGYGKVCVDGMHWRAHRLAYFYTYGETGDLLVLHHCDNPVCVKPEHLFLGTCKENTQDMLKKERDSLVGSRNFNAKLTEEQVAVIKNLYSSGCFTHQQIADRYKVHRSTVTYILCGKQWKHVS